MKIGLWILASCVTLTAGSVGLVKLTATPKERAALITKSFAPYAPKVKTRNDDTWYFVESNGIPDHELMTGIVAWQQQVPIPQNYTGTNAWQFPLFPKPAEKPMSAKEGFFRGAIAIAANGVPIFNPIKNDGRTDTKIAGELDNFGGHSGRGDDYHYHIAPTHLQKELGKKTPIAYALDGYPLYGTTCENGKEPKDLDSFNGHTTKSWGYHYHATKNYPYLNGGFHGEVVEREGQVDPQPRAQSPRPATPPLRGAKITAFSRTGDNVFDLTYELGGEKHHVKYSIGKDGAYTFEFINADGTKRVDTYPAPRQGRGPRPGGRGPAPNGDAPRKPWILEHATELDTNHDKSVTLVEVNALIRDAYQQVAGTSDSISLDALKAARPAKNVIGGYLKGHADEFDENGDKSISLQEVLDEFASLFHKADKNHDHTLTEEETKGT